MNSPIAKKIKSIRNRLNLTQYEFGNAAGISKSFVAHMEAGRMSVSLVFALKIETNLGLKRPEISGTILKNQGLDQRAVAKLLSASLPR